MTPKLALKYQPKGRRNPGRPKKRWIEQYEVNVNSPKREVEEKFSKQPPRHKQIYQWHRKFVEDGCICKQKSTGRPRTSNENVEYIHTVYERSPKKSTTQASRELNIPQPTVWRVLKHHLHMKPYKLQLFHPDDHNNDTIPGRWIGRGGGEDHLHHRWPRRSPDLTPFHRRNFKIVNVIESEVETTINQFVAYSLALDESTDRNDKAHLAIFIRGVNEHFTVSECLLDVITKYKWRRSFPALKGTIEQKRLNFQWLVSIATDGDPTS
ncbi:hypothetical protein ANN_20673 [Periplaneta americana]|uniref:DUF4817 domain-containing protein n=1 Tax=Periplaneta americana TaxID=6978 RepID=A0ABQ8SDB4_PERAM|nr:hypothetical protein ANN_20673 [Periplaneta americana]